MKKRKSAQVRAFTIIEVIVIVVILGVLAAVVAPRVFQRVGDSKQSAARSSISSLTVAMKNYMLDNNGLPEAGSTIDVLWENPGNLTTWKGPYVDNSDALIDPWGNKYILVIPPQFNADFDIVSYGKDGQAGGEGENADVVSGKRN